MLTKEQNEHLTRVENDAPMGRLTRENYWLPLMRPQALVAGAPATSVRLLGENYVAFRAEDGRIGFVDEACPHRGPLWRLRVSSRARCVAFSTAGRSTLRAR